MDVFIDVSKRGADVIRGSDSLRVSVIQPQRVSLLNHKQSGQMSYGAR